MRDDPHIQLMLAFQEGDEAAFQELFQIFKKPLLNFVFRFCQDRRVAEELTQEVFIRVYRSAASYRPDAKFSTWVYRIATNICLNEMRSGKYQYERSFYGYEGDSSHVTLESTVADKTPNVDDRIEDEESSSTVRKAIAALPDKQRIALLLSVYEQIPYKEIGERLQCSEGAVKSIIHRAKLAVKDILSKELKK